MIYFTADWHLHHNNIVNLCKRPWLPSDNDSMVLGNCNQVVTEKDILVVIGDFCLSRELSVWQAYCRRIRAKTILCVRGNHDLVCKNMVGTSNWKVVEEMDKYCEVVDDGDQVWDTTFDNRRFVLCHYPMRSWNHQHKGAVHLFGHVHGRLEGQDTGNSIDVGIDNQRWGYRPVSLGQIKKWMTTERGMKI